MENNVDKEDGRWDPSSGSYDSGGKVLLSARSAYKYGVHVFINLSLHTGDSGLERASGTEMDEQRKQNLAYQYLCHLEEAKV